MTLKWIKLHISVLLYYNGGWSYESSVNISQKRNLDLK